MMKIEVEKLDDKLNDLFLIEDKYNTFCLNYYNSLFNLKDYWTTVKGINFLDNVEKEKREFMKLLLCLKEFEDIYVYLISEYKKIGKNIKYNFDKRDDLIRKINDYNNKVNSLLYKYENLEFNNIDLNIKERLLNEKSNLKKCIDSISKFKRKNKNVMNYIEIIKKNVISKASKVNVEIVQEFNYSDFVNKICNKSFDEKITDIEQMELIVNKISTLKKEEDLIFDDLKKCYYDMQLYYKSDDLFEISSQIINELKKIINNHDNTILLLYKEMSNVSDLEKKISNSFSQIGEDINILP